MIGALIATAVLALLASYLVLGGVVWHRGYVTGHARMLDEIAYLRSASDTQPSLPITCWDDEVVITPRKVPVTTADAPRWVRPLHEANGSHL